MSKRNKGKDKNKGKVKDGKTRWSASSKALCNSRPRWVTKFAGNSRITSATPLRVFEGTCVLVATRTSLTTSADAWSHPYEAFRSLILAPLGAASGRVLTAYCSAPGYPKHHGA